MVLLRLEQNQFRSAFDRILTHVAHLC
jgi:hypothetical protein